MHMYVHCTYLCGLLCPCIAMWVKYRFDTGSEVNWPYGLRVIEFTYVPKDAVSKVFSAERLHAQAVPWYEIQIVKRQK